MVGNSENLFNWVNGAQIVNFEGKKVSIIALASDVSAGSVSFPVKSSDNKNVRITMNAPLTEDFNCYIQIIGTARAGGIQADEIIRYTNQTFDAENYNAITKILAEHPEFRTPQIASLMEY